MSSLDDDGHGPTTHLHQRFVRMGLNRDEFRAMLGLSRAKEAELFGDLIGKDKVTGETRYVQRDVEWRYGLERAPALSPRDGMVLSNLWRCVNLDKFFEFMQSIGNPIAASTAEAFAAAYVANILEHKDTP